MLIASPSRRRDVAGSRRSMCRGMTRRSFTASYYETQPLPSGSLSTGHLSTTHILSRRRCLHPFPGWATTGGLGWDHVEMGSLSRILDDRAITGATERSVCAVSAGSASIFRLRRAGAFRTYAPDNVKPGSPLVDTTSLCSTSPRMRALPTFPRLKTAESNSKPRCGSEKLGRDVGQVLVRGASARQDES